MQKSQSEGGFVLIHRTLFKNPSFRNDAEAMAFAWMVARAQWKPIRVRYKERIISLERGQLSVSTRDMANAMDRDKGWVERLWKRLKSDAMIETDGETGVNIVTICNYDKYQSIDKAGETGAETPDETGARQGQDTEQRREQANKGMKVEGKASPLPASPGLNDAMVLWNKGAASAGWPSVRMLSDGRRKALGARLKDHGADGWRAALIRAHASPYLGQDPPSWFTFDWIIAPTNFIKLIEGNYDRRDQGTSARNSGSAGPDKRDGFARALDRRIAAADTAERSAVGEGEDDRGNSAGQLALLR